MKNLKSLSIYTFLSLCALFITSCKKTTAIPDSTNLIDSIIGKRFYRLTDSVVYSFKLEKSGNWITYKGGDSTIQGSYTIDYKNSKLFHIYNGQQEEYEIIEPTSTRVKFKGGQNSNSQIAPINVLLVYDTKIDISSLNYIPLYAEIKIKYDYSIDISKKDLTYIYDKSKPFYLFNETNSNQIISVYSNCIGDSKNYDGKKNIVLPVKSPPQVSAKDVNDYKSYYDYHSSKFSYQLINNEKFLVCSADLKHFIYPDYCSTGDFVYYKIVN
jgi:hypothetical protein